MFNGIRAWGKSAWMTAAFVLAFFAGVSAWANTITAGNDSFTTQPTAGSSYNFGPVPIPAGFFGPWSDPFAGKVQLGGGAGSGVDTIVHRMTDGVMGGPPTGTTVPIEIVALNLVSVNPITVTYDGGSTPELWNVRIVQDENHPSIGQMTVALYSPGGGAFSSILNVRPVLYFTRLADCELLPMPRLDFVTQPAAPWSTTIPDGVLPTTNNFFPGGVPGDPTQLNDVLFIGGGLSLDLRLTTVPEPATISLALLGAGALGFLRYIRRQRMK